MLTTLSTMMMFIIIDASNIHIYNPLLLVQKRCRIDRYNDDDDDDDIDDDVDDGNDDDDASDIDDVDVDVDNGDADADNNFEKR